MTVPEAIARLADARDRARRGQDTRDEQEAAIAFINREAERVRDARLGLSLPLRGTEQLS
jgi:hypothetical protein